MRIAFMGTPEFAVPALHALHEAGHNIVAVYSQPPRKAGRGKKLRPSPVKIAAETLALDVRTPVSFKDPTTLREFQTLNLDVAVVAAYGLLLPQAILDAPHHGCLNIHGSLLPRWRGAAPVQRAMLAGDTQTGITIMQMEAGLDTGPMLLKSSTEIASKTAGELTDELSHLGAHLMTEYLESPGRFSPEPQNDELATYARKIEKSEARIDFTRPAASVLTQIRAFNPVPGAFFEYEGDRYRIHRAAFVDDKGEAGCVLDDTLTIACADGAIRPSIIQKSGRPKLGCEEFLRGNPISAGTRL